MKTIQQVRSEWKCPKGHDRRYYSFTNGESVHCEKCESSTCSGDYDLGIKKWQ